MAEAGLINYGRKTLNFNTNITQPNAAATNHSLPQVPRTSTIRSSERTGCKKRKLLTLATWNVRTLLDNENSNRPERRTALVAKELERYNIDIAALSETRLAEQGKPVEAGTGYTFLWSGVPKNTRREHGVGLAIATRIVPRLVEEPNCINPRIMSARFRISKGKFATLISTYAPKMTHTDEDKNEFYSQLSQVLRATHPSDQLFLLGDLNARVGRDSSTWKKIIGPFGIGTDNDNGQRLLSLCAAFELSITNTWFNPGHSPIATWTHPRSKHGHLRDYIIVRQRDLKNVLVTKVLRGAECHTDHLLVRMKLRVVLERTRRHTTAGRSAKLNVQKLNDPELRIQFQRAIAEEFPDATTLFSIEEQWTRIKSGVERAATNILGTQQAKRRDWFDENTNVIFELLQQKNSAHASAVQNPNNSIAQETFREIRRKFKENLRQIKNSWWRNMSAEIQYHADHRHQKEFYDSLKTVYGPKIQCLQTVENPETHQKLTQATDIAAVWKKHFSSLLNRPTKLNWSRLDSVEQRQINETLADYPSQDELDAALNQLRNGKAPGEDGLCGELFKYGGPHLKRELMKLICVIWEAERVPEDLKNATIIPLFKGKGNRQKVNNYRGISLLSAAGKILARILLNRLNAEILNALVPEEQCGFRKQRSTIDLIFAMRQLQEKCRERNQPLYALFVDFTKAFDSVNRQALWKILQKLGCPGKFINIIKALHEGMRAKVRSCSTTSADFTVDTGVKQGCVLAPTLFSLYLTVVCAEAFRDTEDGVPIQYRLEGRLFDPRRLSSPRLQNATLRLLLFADDCALLAHSEAELQRLTTRFAAAAEDFGLEINASKTVVFYQPVAPGDSRVPVITVSGNPIGCCSDFCYLGSILTNDLSIGKELRSRIAKASTAFGKLRKRVWDNRDLRLDTKVAVYRAVILSTLLYGSETWTVYRSHIRLLDRFHQYCLRHILRIHWSDRVSNTRVLQKANMTGIEAQIMRNKLRWAGHVRRMSDERLPKQLLYGTVKNGYRKRGCPKLRYSDTLKVSLKLTNFDLGTWEELAENRTAWRAATYDGVQSFEQRRTSLIEDKRAARKRQHPSLTNQPDGPVCPNCGKQCLSRIGLIGHQRIHADPCSKRRRVS